MAKKSNRHDHEAVITTRVDNQEAAADEGVEEVDSGNILPRRAQVQNITSTKAAIITEKRLHQRAAAVKDTAKMNLAHRRKHA
jgi:hypothetical protein